MKKLNRKSASPPFKKTHPCTIFPLPFFNFSHSPLLGEVIEIYSHPLKKKKKDGGGPELWPPDNPENQNFKIEKNTWRYHSTHLHQMTIIWYIVPEIWSMTDRFFCHSGLFFALFPQGAMDPENQNFEKIKKTHEDNITLHICTINDSHMMYGSWDMECNRQNFLSF